MKKIVVVGAGITGAVIARVFAEKGYPVEILERRNHIAGNLYDYKDSFGIIVHQYGPHIFHTNDENVYKFINRFSKWIPFHLICKAEINGKETNSPFNFQTIDDFFREEAEDLKKRIQACYPGQEFAYVLDVLHSTDEKIRKYAEFLFENDYRPYTAKQWGVPPETIAPSVLKRVPLRFSYNDGYFSDKYQVMPENGYTSFIKKMLSHENISVHLGHDFLKGFFLSSDGKRIEKQDENDFHVFYTGPVDELFQCCYGILPYRSLHFEWKHEDKSSFQSAPVVAYPQRPGYTRITEYNKLPIQKGDGTTYAVEYPLKYEHGENEPYYPVPTEESIALYGKYQGLAFQVKNLTLAGRLAEFKYYNMDQAIAKALEICSIY